MQIRRPNNYDITLALMLGPTDPNPTMDVSAALRCAVPVQALLSAGPAPAPLACPPACLRPAA